MILRGIKYGYFNAVTDDAAPAGTAGAEGGAAVSGDGTATATASQAAGTAQQPGDAGQASGSTGQEAGAPNEQPAAQPRDWAAIRDAYAKGDEKLAKRLGRYSSIEAALDAMLAAQNKIAEGPKARATLPDNATPEQLAAYRADNGIPEEPTGYELKLADGTALTDEHKALANDLLQAAHAANIPGNMVNTMVNNLLDLHQKEAAEAEEAAAKARAEGENELRVEWGSEYTLNSNMVMNLLNAAPEGIKDSLLGGTLADGTPIAHSPQAMRWLANLAREINPVATVVPNSGTDAVDALETERAHIKSLMGDRNSEYYKGPKAAGLQKRYEDIVRALSKAKARA